ncbi:MAG: hypothetical protein COB89_00295 [Piscirickettsiaceae bacterium]|nr:MAG: hypothetical protein COB89_00295 [Piscirickettsiaceae bacterium]
MYFHDAQTQIILPDGQTYDGSLLDISLNGCLLNLVDADIDIDTMKIPELAITLDDGLVISALAEAVFINKESQLGLRFTNIGLDSITSLKHLVELNLSNSNFIRA